MKLPRFTLRDMFLATTLIAVGVGIAVALLRSHPQNMDLFSPLAAAAFIGACVFAPFHRKQIGAAIGALVMLLFFVLGMLYAFFNFHG